MPSLRWITGTPFGTLPVLDADAEAPPLEDPTVVTILGWAINKAPKACRLTLAHQGTHMHIKVRSDNAYGKHLYETVVPCWNKSNLKDDSDYWSSRHALRDAMSNEAEQKEDGLLELVDAALPHLFKDDKPSPGSQLWAEVGVDPSDQASLPQVKIVGDVFRQLVVRDLPTLPETDFANIPRMDMSEIVGYCPQQVWMQEVFPVLIRHGEEKGPAKAALKTIKVPNDFQDWNKDEEQVTDFYKKLLWDELDHMTTLPPHPNVLPAPLALVTISHTENNATSTKLVGWLHHEYHNWYSYLPHTPGTEEAAAHCLRFAYELCCGTQHFIKNGIYHSDLAMEHSVWTGTPPNDRYMISDLKLRNTYRHKNGPKAPEVSGDWEVSMDSDGKLVYTRCKGKPVDLSENLFHDWKSMPEALERVLVFNIGSIISVLVHFRMVFPWVPPGEFLRRGHLREAPEVGADPERDAWEALIPQAVQDLAQKCSSYDPRERPLLQDVISALEPYKNVSGA
ncbi:hypothetical protein A4X13_0g7036 [Tilletia indica]|uniref:Uncharacterized protein n=1 Tax=Tilletia indica TaxID=43049 RepID=A0A177TEX4_9BASI|nr:hypothetical protein A4X13_0g7036 [Tilletia indica]